jgi:hypothetical protein
LLALKKEEHEKRGWEFDGTLYLWDYRWALLASVDLAPPAD